MSLSFFAIQYWKSVQFLFNDLCFTANSRFMSGHLTWKSYVDYCVARGSIDEFMIVSAVDASHWASTNDFMLREYVGTIVHEDGSEKEETINEAVNILQLVSGSRPFHGLRLNGGKKQQILRSSKDEESGNYIIFGKITRGGSCIATAGKCILIATHSEPKGHTAAGCNETVIEMAKYLAQANWPTAELVPRDSGRIGGGSDWQPFITEMLIGRGNLSDALICNKDDGTVYASSPGFTLQTYHMNIEQEDGTETSEQVDEAKNIVIMMRGSQRPSQGLRLNHAEKKYQIIKSGTDETTGTFIVFGKKVITGPAFFKLFVLSIKLFR